MIINSDFSNLQTDELLHEVFNGVSFYKDLFIHDISNIIKSKKRNNSLTTINEISEEFQNFGHHINPMLVF